MKIQWLATTAVALIIGTGAVVAQSQPDQKREETPRTQSAPSKSEDGRADRQQDRKAQSNPTGGERKQAQDEQPAKQPAQQSQDRKDRGDRPAAAQDEQKGRDTKQAQPKQQDQKQDQARDAKQPGDQKQKQQSGNTQQRKQDNEARDAKQPGDQKQQAGETRQQKRDNQARDAKQPGDQKQQTGQQPSPTTSQQAKQPSDTKTGQSRNQTSTETSRTTASGSANIDERQRTEIVNKLRRDRSATSTNINIDVNIGTRLPSRARIRPLPQDIVRIMPQYRGYQYTVVEDEIVVVEPRTRKVVEVIREPGASASVRSTSRSGSSRISISSEQRETLKQSARRLTTAQTSGGSSSLSDTSCLQLQAIPDELARSNPELGSYRMLAIGDQVILVDPREKKIVEVVE